MTELTQAKIVSQLNISRTSVHYILNGYPHRALRVA
jgi:hypothetical protein